MLTLMDSTVLKVYDLSPLYPFTTSLRLGIYRVWKEQRQKESTMSFVVFQEKRRDSLNKRQGYPVDIEKLIDVVKNTNTILEIDVRTAI